MFLSLILILFGVLLLLENLGISENLVGRYWPVALIILGVTSLFSVFRLRIRFNQLRDRLRGRFGGRWPPDIDGR